MKILYFLILAIVLPALSSFTNKSDFENLKALTGTWKMQTTKGSLFEEWALSENKTIKGRSYRLNVADTIVLENTSIVNKADVIFFVAVVPNQNNQEPVSFKLVSSNNSKFIFENKEHDFPQRVIYRLINPDSIAARIEGSIKGKEKSSDFYYRRIK